MQTASRTIGGAASIALASSLLLATPASAAAPAPVDLGNFGNVGLQIHSETVDMGPYLLFAGSTDAGIGCGARAQPPPAPKASRTSTSADRAALRGSSPAPAARPTSSRPRQRTGVSLWKTNGTSGGTVEVEDLVPGTGGPAIDDIAASRRQDRLQRRRRGQRRRRLWISDGTPAGTTLLKDINAVGDSSPSNLTLHDGEVYFAAHNGSHGRELWKTDGTTGGTVMVDDVNPGNGSSSPAELVSDGSTLLFSAVDAQGREIFRSKGTAPSTYRMRDINPGTANSNPTRLTATGGATFFTAQDPLHGDAVEDRRDDRRHGARQGHPTGNQWVDAQRATSNGDTIVFRAAGSANDAELWTSDGSAAGTRLVKDIRPGAAGSSPRDFSVNPDTGRTLFSADDGSSGVELWLTNGTADGTARVSDLAPGSATSDPAPVGAVGSGALFRTNGQGGSKLWVLQTNGLEVVLAGTPSISGQAAVGRMLTAVTGVWEAGASCSYTWLRDGVSIPGATGATYRATAKDHGHKPALESLATRTATSRSARRRQPSPSRPARRSSGRRPASPGPRRSAGRSRSRSVPSTAASAEDPVVAQRQDHQGQRCQEVDLQAALS
ncbi:ELWxxDGT repeat protein [Aeromicrobium sp. UC242_57]|uniref:ELWxxDGT repeat protein n=1 Tax=Aeromicrobium sp. UC242_57 TaxID=3374624 RepID=UPI0037B838D0